MEQIVSNCSDRRITAAHAAFNRFRQMAPLYTPSNTWLLGRTRVDCQTASRLVQLVFTVVKFKFHETVFRVASSCRIREDVSNKSCVSGVPGDFPVQLATCLPDWSAGGLLRCSAARLSVCHCYGHPREDVTKMLRGELVPWNSSFTTQTHRPCYEQQWSASMQ